MPPVRSDVRINPRCPKCGCTSDRIEPGKFRCRVRECRIYFDAADPDFSRLVDGDTIGTQDRVSVGLIKGKPTPWPRCPNCGGTSDKLPDGRYMCRVRECRVVHDGSVLLN